MQKLWDWARALALVIGLLIAWVFILALSGFIPVGAGCVN